MSTSRQLDIATWLVSLAVRCTPRSTENIEVLARDYATGLDDLPTEAFTLQSKEAAARHFEHFPAYKPLRSWLDKWWSANKTTRPLLPPVDDPDLSPEDRGHVRSWINLRKEGGDLARRLSLYRDKWPRAFGYIVRTDAQATAIAKGRGWIQDEAPVDVSEAGIARNLVKLEKLAGENGPGPALAQMGLSMLRKNVEQRAPERLHLLPERIFPPSKEPTPDWRAGPAAPKRSMEQQRAAMGDPPASPTVSEQQEAAFVAQNGRSPGQMTPEQIAAMRNAAGINLPPPANANEPVSGFPTTNEAAKSDEPPTIDGEVVKPDLEHAATATVSASTRRDIWED